MKGIVSSIEIAAEEGAPVVAVDAVNAVPGRGLEGDRYFVRASGESVGEHAADSEVTFIEMENIEEFNQRHQTAYTSADVRRNIATRGIRLNELCGREFSIGEVRLRGHRLCEPCNHLASLTTSDILPGLLHKGGLRAEVISGGTIRVGDAIEVGDEVRETSASAPSVG